MAERRVKRVEYDITAIDWRALVPDCITRPESRSGSGAIMDRLKDSDISFKSDELSVVITELIISGDLKLEVLIDLHEGHHEICLRK